MPRACWRSARIAAMLPGEGRKTMRLFRIAAATLVLAGCDGRGETEADNQAVAATNQVSAPMAAGAATPAAKPSQVLAADGIAPGLRFGMKQAEAVAAATAAFGPGGKPEHNAECGE